MRPVDRRTKLVSFRVSPDEYSHLRQACSARGMRSVSEFARIAMQTLVRDEGAGVIPLDIQVRELREQIAALSAQLEHLAQRVPLDISSAATSS